MLKKVQISIQSIQYQPPEPHTDDDELEQPETILQKTSASWRETDEELSLTYTDPDEQSQGEVRMQFFFRKDDPQTVTLTRSGNSYYQLLFCEGRRCSCDYNVGGMMIKLTTHTTSLQNRLLEDGTLHLEYMLELQGCSNGKRVIDIQVEPQSDTTIIREYRS